MEPTTGMSRYRSIKLVHAGEITEIASSGAYVKNADGSAVFRAYQSGMTVHYTPRVGDYWVAYTQDGDDYQSISPRDVFLRGYVPQVGDADAPAVLRPPCGIGWAIKQMWNGYQVRRPGWNGKGMWLSLVRGGDWNLDTHTEVDLSMIRGRIDGYQRRGDFIAMRTADGNLVPWLASQTDLLAMDWEISPVRHAA